MTKISDKITATSGFVELQATRTNVVDNSVLDIVGASSGKTNAPSSVDFASAYCERDNNGNYTLHIQCVLNTANVSVFRWHITGCDYALLSRVDGGPVNSSIAMYQSATETSTQIFTQASGNDTKWSFDAAIPLSGQPSWFNDNLMTSSGLPVATASTYGVVKQGLVAKKNTPRIARPSSGMVTDLEFNNLEIGKTYEYRAILNCSGAAGGALDATINIYSNSAPLMPLDVDFSNSAGNSYEGVVTLTWIFQTQAGQTNVGAQLVSVSNFAMGGDAFLIERPDLDLSSGYTSKYD